MPPATPFTRGTVDDMVQTIVSYFPPVTGEVIWIEGIESQVNLGWEIGLSKGILLTVYRETEPILHPTTGVLIGVREEVLTDLEVKEVLQHTAMTVRLSNEQEIGLGDRVRLSALRIPLAVVVSEEAGAHPLTQALLAAFSDTKRFKIEKLSSPATLEDAAQKGLLYFMRIQVVPPHGTDIPTSKGDTYRLHLTLQNTKTGGVLADTEVEIAPASERDSLLEQFRRKQ